MRDGIGIASVRNGWRGICRSMGAMSRRKRAMAVVLLAAGIAVPSWAQTLTLANQVFPVTQVGQSATQNVTLTVNADVFLYYMLTDPANPEYAAANFGSIVGTTPTGATLTPWYTLVPAGTVFTVPVTFSPALPGQASSPTPIARSGMLQVVYVDPVLGLVTASLPLQGTGAGPKGVLSPGLISDLVGSDATPTAAGYGGDGGPAPKALFSLPGAIAMDVLGNLYIADTGNSVVRVVFKAGAQLAQLIALENPGTTAKAGNIYTVAGETPALIPAYAPKAGAGVDGVLATQSPLNSPGGIALDAAGNLYISDTGNQAVRVVAAATGLINTVAGTLNNGGVATAPGCCFSGDAGSATAAQLYNPAGLAVDGYGNLYIADSGNHAIRAVYAAGAPLASLIATEAGGMAAAAGSIYTIAGGPSNAPPAPGAIGDGTLATTASLNTPLGVTVDSAGNIYISDSQDNEVRRVDAVSGAISAVFQTAGVPAGLGIDAADNVYFTLLNSCTVWQSQRVYINYQNIGANVVAGNGSCAASGDGGPSTFAGLNGAAGVVVDGSGNLYILEADGVRFVDASQTVFAFGPVNVGSTSAALTATVMDEDIAGSPYGLQPGGYYSLTAPFASAPFAGGSYGATLDCNANNYSLGPGQSCGIALDLQPVADGPFAASAYYYDSKIISLTGTGTGPLPTATLSGGPLTFTGVAGMGFGPVQTLTLTAGSVNLSVSQIYTGSYYFKESDNCGPLPKVLPANTSCTISINYAASSTAPVSGTVSVVDNASSGGGTQTVSLSGTGTAPVAGVVPGGIAFATTAPGTASPASLVTITNTGTAALTFCSAAIVSPSTAPACFDSGSAPIGPFTISGNEADRFSVSGTTCGATLAIAASCTVSITFAPTMPGYFTATLGVNDNSGGSGLRNFYATQQVGLTGFSNLPTGTSNLAAENTTFPATAVTQTTTQTVTLHLYDAVALKSIAIQSGYGQYSIGPVTGCTIDGTTVNPAGTICSIPVAFAPSAPGNAGSPTSARTAPLIVTTAENGGTPYAFGLAGTGTGPVAALTPGIISNYVGGSGGVCAGILGEDGLPAANAYVGFLNGMALDSAGNLYLSDSMNFVLWQVDPQGFIHLYAGNPFQCGGYDQYLNGNGGPALGANVEDGGPLAVDAKGGLYIGNNAANSTASIRYISPVTKVITSVVGNLGNVYNSATLSNQGNSWEANTYFYAGSILQESVSTPNPVGSGFSNVNYLFTATQGGTSGSAGPNFTNIVGGTVRDGSVVWTNSGAGTTTGVGCPGQTDSFGDGCTGTNAKLYGVSGIALDQAGNLYFADRYKLVPIGNGSLQAVYNAVVRRMDAKTGIVTIYAGTGTIGHSGDGGLATSAQITPGDLAFDSGGNLFIDEGLYVRKVDAATGIITTVAGSGVASRYRQDVCYGDAGDGGLATAAGFGGVTGMALDAADNLYLVDTTACNVRRVDAGTQKIATIAGNYSAYGWDTGDVNNPYANWDGSAYQASLAQPLLARVDGMGNIYVMQMSRGVRKIDVSQSVMSFASAQIDTASAPLTTTVLNAGNSGWVDFTNPFTAAPAWGISSGNWTRDVTDPTGNPDCYDVKAIGIGYECPVNVDFTPLVAGTLTGVNTVTDNGVNNPQTITLLGTASGTAPNVTLLPFLLSYSTPQNGLSTQNLTLTNNGSGPVSIAGIAIAGADAAAFSEANNCQTSLAAGLSCTILVTFHPPVVGGTFVNMPPPDILKAQVIVTDNDASSPQIANLIGIGTLPALASSLSISITEAVQISDNETLRPALVLNILETVHASDAAPAVVLPMQLKIAETIHAMDAMSSLAPSTLLRVFETIHTTDAMTALRPSTLVRLLETIHIADGMTSLNPSTLLNVGERIHLLDSISPVPSQSLALSERIHVADALAAVPVRTAPAIAWPTPAAIAYGTALSATQLDASSPIAGNFSYAPVAGTLLTAGSHTLSATFTPNNAAEYETVSASVTLVVNPAAQSIAFAPLASPVNYGAVPIALQATGGGSGNPIVFSVVSGPGSIAGKTLTFTGAGVVVVAANQAGNSNYSAAPQGTQSIVVNQIVPAIAVSSNSNPVLVQNSIVLTATVSSGISTPTGTVNFRDGATLLGSSSLLNGVAALTTSALPVGSHNIVAAYAGDANFVAATSAALTEVVDDFTLVLAVSGGVSSPLSVTALPGGVAVYTFTVTPDNAAVFPAPIVFSASGLPAGATATFSPAAIATGAGTTTVTLTIQLPQTAAAALPSNELGRRLAPFALALLLLPFAGRLRRSAKRLAGTMTLLLMLLGGMFAMTALSGCISGGGWFAQQPQTYTVTATGTSGALSHSSTVTLIVQ